jgi:hypothetical protein
MRVTKLNIETCLPNPEKTIVPEKKENIGKRTALNIWVIQSVKIAKQSGNIGFVGINERIYNQFCKMKHENAHFEYIVVPALAVSVQVTWPGIQSLNNVGNRCKSRRKFLQMKILVTVQT